jgi:uncharacterized membrane protein
VLIHFPIALFITAVAFDCAAQWTRNRTPAALVWWIHWCVRRQPAGRLPTYRLPIEAVAVLLVGLTAHLGGFLSGVNRPG